MFNRMDHLAWTVGVVLVVLKLAHLITCSWWLITLPFWFSWATLVVMFFAIVALAVIAAWLNASTPKCSFYIRRKVRK